MRKSFLKTLCCITAVLLVIQVFTFAAFAEETRILTNDNYQNIPTMYENTQGYETIQDKNGLKTVVKNRGQKSSQLAPSDIRQTAADSVIGRVDLNNFVKLLVPERDIYSVTLTYKYYYSDTGYYYSDILKGSTVVVPSTAYSSTNYFDWTPTEAGTDYRVVVYVREPVSGSTPVSKTSSYFTVTAPVPKVTETPGPDTTEKWLGSINIIDIPLVK